MWGAAAWAIVVATAVHMAHASRKAVPLPHLAILIATLQYGLAPLVAYYFPASSSQYWIADFPAYFSYAGPALVAIVLGWAASWSGLRITAERRYRNEPGDAGRRPPAAIHTARDSNHRRGPEFAGFVENFAGHDVSRELDWMFWGGIGLKLALGDQDLGGLSFFVLLLADLRFLGLMGLILLRVPGWRWRAVVLVLLEANEAVGSAMFHEQILWALSFFALYAFLRRPPLGLYLGWLLLICIGVFVLNDAKWQLRGATWGGTGQVTAFGTTIGLTSWNKPMVGGLCLLQSATKVFTGGFSDDALGDMIQRFNQGWIIDRVVHHVPAQEPYASGETIVSALVASILPRFVLPEKHDVSGTGFMERFAGYPLAPGTSMNIGFAGEMYANFGYWGGILGCGIYALVLGLTLRWVCIRARQSSLWWAVALYAAHWAFKAETDIGAVLNYLVKAALVVFLVARCLPAFRAELAGRVYIPSPNRPRRRMTGPLKAEG